MHKRNTISTGFTIVELLIVVVVIAILAAISIVTYSNFQNRAYDSAIQHDLNNFAKKIQLAAVDSGDYPPGGAVDVSVGVRTGNQTLFPGFKFQPSKSAYDTSVQNLHYCTGPDSETGRKIFRVQARSRSGNSFLYSSKDGVTNVGNVFISGTADTVAAAICAGIAFPRSWSYGYYSVSNSWWGWTNE